MRLPFGGKRAAAIRRRAQKRLHRLGRLRLGKQQRQMRERRQRERLALGKQRRREAVEIVGGERHV